MARFDTINGTEAVKSRARPDFADLIPIHPDERLRHREIAPAPVAAQIM